MSSIKHFVAKSFTDNPQRYGNDSGDLNIINDCFKDRGYELITREQYQVLQTTLRERNKYLAANPSYDHRTNKSSKPMYIQHSLFDFVHNPQHYKTLISFFTAEPTRLDLDDGVIAELTSVTIESVIAFKQMPDLFLVMPTLKSIPKHKENN